MDKNKLRRIIFLRKLAIQKLARQKLQKLVRQKFARQRKKREALMKNQVPCDTESSDEEINKQKFSVLTIDIMIPIFYKTQFKKKLTILQLKYLEHIYHKLKENNILISLTIVGQPYYKEEIEKYINFNNDNKFIIFNQFDFNVNYRKGFFKNHKFKNMLHNKIKQGLSKSFEKKKDFSCFLGSNDFICYEWFLSLKTSCFQNEKKVIGIHKTTKKSIKNYEFIFQLNKNSKIKDLKESISWNGIYSKRMYNSYGNYYYFGGILGFSKSIYNDILKYNNLWNEISIERECIKSKYKIIRTSNNFFLNIKSDSDLSKLAGLKKHLLPIRGIINPEIIDKKNKLLKLLDELYTSI